MKRQQGRVWSNGRVPALRKGSDSLRNEPVPFSQPTKICSLGRRLEMRPGGRGAGMKMSTTQVGVCSAGGLLGDQRKQISAGSCNPLVTSSVFPHYFLCLFCCVPLPTQPFLLPFALPCCVAQAHPAWTFFLSLPSCWDCRPIPLCPSRNLL